MNTKKETGGLGKRFHQQSGMIHAVPVIDFVGSIQIKSLEVGSIEMNAQSIPAVRFLLDQQRSYPILAFGHQAGEIYAYCAVALEMGIVEIDVKITCTLLTDINGSLHVTTASIAWYTSSELREQVAARLEHVFEKSAQSEFKAREAPFIVVKTEE